ncbi:MAG: phosphate ABC transporter permease PstA [Chloroflexi bacterium]|nr:phosphate ABC transporter permease PstA [Chloroflexota bacterium]
MPQDLFAQIDLPRVYRRRRFLNDVALSLTGVAVALAVIPLVWIVVYVFLKGMQNINLDFFIHLPQAMGTTGGGVTNAIQGSIVMVLVAVVVAIPIALLVAFYLLFHPQTLLGQILRFSTDLLAGVPSIVIGLFGYAILVVPFKHFSALAGGLVLAMIMLPIVIRSAEEMLKLVPKELREGALALGAPEWKTSLSVVLVAALEGIVTGVMLAIARATGETAPLLFTALGNEHYNVVAYVRQGISQHQSIFQILHKILAEPTDALPLTLWKYAQQPYPERVAQSWTVALVLMFFVLALNIGARSWLARKRRQTRG